MYFPYLSLGALAVTTNAFLVPLYSDNPNPAHDLSIKPASQTITLDCSTCPYALKSERNGVHEWTNDVASELETKLEVVGNAITFNGVAIYPVTNPTLPPVLTVKQNVKQGVETSMEGLEHGLRLSYSLAMAAKPFEDGNSLISITISPMALDGQMIRIDDIEIKAIKDSAGTITLHTIATTTPPVDSPDAQCTNIMCRVMAKLLSGITRVKSATMSAAKKVKCLCVKCLHCVLHMMGHKSHHNKHNHHLAPPPPADALPLPVELPTHHHGRPMVAHAHHNWEHKGFFARVAHMAWVTVKIAFIPILIGVAFGMAASAIGMLVGQLVVFLWIRYRRNDAVAVYEVLATDEKEEVPPPYEDLPVAAREVMEKDVEGKA